MFNCNFLLRLFVFSLLFFFGFTSCENEFDEPELDLKEDLILERKSDIYKIDIDPDMEFHEIIGRAHNEILGNLVNNIDLRRDILTPEYLFDLSNHPYNKDAFAKMLKPMYLSFNRPRFEDYISDEYSDKATEYILDLHSKISDPNSKLSDIQNFLASQEVNLYTENSIKPVEKSDIQYVITVAKYSSKFWAPINQGGEGNYKKLKKKIRNSRKDPPTGEPGPLDGFWQGALQSDATGFLAATGVLGYAGATGTGIALATGAAALPATGAYLTGAAVGIGISSLVGGLISSQGGGSGVSGISSGAGFGNGGSGLATWHYDAQCDCYVTDWKL